MYNTQIDQGGPSTKGIDVESIINTYLETPPSTRQSNTSSDIIPDPILALFSITPHQWAEIGNVRTKKIAKAVLADLASNECKWSASVRSAAWKTMKEFSRIPASSLALSDSTQIQSLIQILISFRDHISSANESSSSKNDSELEHLDLALRVLNNILFQQAESRQSFAKSIEGIRCCLDLLDNPGTPMIVFLCARLIFYATLSPTDTLREAVQNTQLIETFTIRLSALLQQPQTSEVEMAEAELLKAFFNISLHLPRLTESTNGNQAGEEYFDETLLPFLAPTVRVLADVQRRNNIAELRSPFTNAIAVLLNFPVQPYEDTWRTGLLSVAAYNTQHLEMNGKLAKLRSSSGGGSESDRSSTTSAMSRSRKAASAFFRSPFNRQSSNNKTIDLTNSECPLLKTLLDMIDAFCKNYFSNKEIDDHQTSQRARNEEEDLEAIGEPALLLLRKLTNGSEKFRSVAKSRILPESIDRKVGLDKREDLTGILIRMMGSQNYPRLARASGEVLLAICGGRAGQMTAEIGYGPCAGFLTNIGQAHAVPESEINDSSGRPIDPITGKVLPTAEEMARQDAESGLSEMTEEEVHTGGAVTRSTRTRPPATAITIDQQGSGSDGHSSKDNQSDKTRVQQDDLGILMPVFNKKGSIGSSPADSMNRKPWSRPISSPYGAANKLMLNSSYATSSTSSPAGSSVTPLMGAAGSAFVDDHDPGRWHTDAKEHDDYLHDPEKPVHKSPIGARGILNIGTLCILVGAILMLFMGYPFLTEFYFNREGKKGGYGLGGTNMTGQVPDLASMSMRQSLVDTDTPNQALTKAGLGPTGTETWNLVFSDEFNVDGRSFYPGDDPIWEAHNLYAHGTGDYEWYDPAAITTKGGALQISVIQDEIHNLNFRSGQLTSWNKFCFTGGYLEASVILPGNPDVSGWWPAIWTMGNLGRANYGATTDGTWPYSYNTCDRGTLINQTDADGLGPAAAITSGGQTTFNNKYHTTDLSWQPGQRLSACTCPGEDHPGPKNSDGSYVGRSAPEIDMFEAQVDGTIGGSLSLSCQFMPASAGYYLANGTGNEYTTNIVHGERVKLNTYRGSVLQMAASGVARTNQQSYQNTGQVFSTWGFEYEPGNEGYITWWMDGIKAWTLTAAAVGADTLAGIAQRPIPEEPMYIIMNVAISSGFGTIVWDQLQYPATMQVDYIRLYQSKDRQNVGCDPEDFPTADYINKHIEAYTNPNYTIWGGDQATGGYGANWPKNKLYNNGNGCAEASRNYPGRLRPNGINQSPGSTVPTRYSGSTANQDDSGDE